MANSKFERNRSELELILGAEERFCRSDERMTILYRLHNLPHRRTEDGVGKFRDQDFVLNLTIGDKYILAQEEEEDHKLGESCYFGELRSTVNNARGDDDNDEDCKKQRLFGDCYSKFVDPRGHCQVGRDKSGPWIKDLGGKFGTFVNGIKLGVGVCYVLKSGDLISLGFIYQEDKPLMLEIGHYWIFKVYEVPQSEYEHRNAVAREAMGNSVIVDTIFSNLNFQDLKRSRTVSPVWDEAAKRKLKPLSSVVFTLYNPGMESDRAVAWNERWNEKAQEKLLALQNIGIRSISFNENNTTLDFPTGRLAFLQNMIRINNQITRVELGFLANIENMLSLFKSILACPQLLEVTFNKIDRRLFQLDEELETNTSVRKLIFKESTSSHAKILQLFPNAREIEITNTMVAEVFLREKFQDELLETVKVLKISNKAKQFETFHCFDCNEDHDTEIYMLTISRMSPLFCALPNSLQLVRLEITNLEDFVLKDIIGISNQLFNLLSKFKNSLEYLKLGLFLHEGTAIRFPEMKMLSVLKIKVDIHPFFRTPSFTSGFGSELFPRLNILDVGFEKLTNELADKIVKKSFGAASHFQNVSVRQLRFVFPNQVWKEQYAQIAENNFREIFPNCTAFYFGVK